MTKNVRDAVKELAEDLDIPFFDLEIGYSKSKHSSDVCAVEHEECLGGEEIMEHLETICWLSPFIYRVRGGKARLGVYIGHTVEQHAIVDVITCQRKGEERSIQLNFLKIQDLQEGNPWVDKEKLEATVRAFEEVSLRVGLTPEFCTEKFYATRIT